MKTSEKIKQARNKAGLTQGELALKLGVSQAMISAYEKGVRNPKWETLRNIANALNVETVSLIGDLDDYSPSEAGKAVLEQMTETIKDAAAATVDSAQDISEELKKIRRIEFMNDYDSLNSSGQYKAAEYLKDLRKIPEYQKEPEE